MNTHTQRAAHRIRPLDRRLRAIALLLSLLAGPAVANDVRPGSLLVFPEFDNRSGSLTLLSVTNASTSENVRVIFLYIYSQTCSEFNRSHLLTPYDNLTLLTHAHSPFEGQGYVVAYAVDGSFNPGPFNHLIGTSRTLSGFDPGSYMIEPFAFEGYAGDLNSNGRRDFDGIEYSMVPDELIFPRFIAENAERFSELVLIDLTGGPSWSTNVDLILYNDNEEAFVTEYSFDCWTRVRLSKISLLFVQEFLTSFSNHDPAEPHLLPQFEMGWMRLRGAVASNSLSTVVNPAVLAFLIERSVGGGASAELPFGVGLNGKGRVPGLGPGAHRSPQ